LSSAPQRSTLDTNVAIYAFSTDLRKAAIARRLLAEAAFVSVQLLNEFANVLVRKQRVSWREVGAKVDDIRLAVPEVVPIRPDHNREALRIGERYRLGFYDSLMLAVALAGGAAIIYSEDMQHDLLIDGTLRIVDPFR
jgi:predicted nucleic acid-binding protein